MVVVVRSALAVALILGACAASPVRTLYVAGDEQTGRWCAFASADQAQASAERLQEAAIERGSGIADVVQGGATIDAGRGLFALRLGYGPHSGDWAVTDDYRLDGSQSVSLQRGIGYADGSPHHTETYARAGERLVLRTRSEGTRYVDMPTVADFEREPYFRLLRQAAARRSLPANGLCVSATPQP